MIYGYTRVSNGGQKLSPAAQREAILAYCKLYELGKPVLLEEEAASGKSIEGRPKMRELLRLIADGRASAVVAYKLDRLFRSSVDAFKFFELAASHDCDVHTVQERLDTSTAGGRMFRGMMVLMAQWERETIGERTSFALQGKKAACGGRQVNGQAPYGSRWRYGMNNPAPAGVENVLEPHPAEQALIRESKGLRAGGTSVDMIAVVLNNEGHLTRTGRPWTAQQVRRLLLSML